MFDAPRADIMNKSDFAALVRRHPSFVTRCIDDGKLSGDALVGTGRSARIRVAPALQQLAMKLDLGQQLAQAAPLLPSPAASTLAGAAGVDRAAAGAAPPAAVDGLQDPLALERAEQVRLRNEVLRGTIDLQAREAAVAAGQLVDAQAVSRALTRQLSPLFNIFDELPATIAKPLADEFGLEYPRVLIAVKQAIRRQRDNWADQAAHIGRAGAVQVSA